LQLTCRLNAYFRNQAPHRCLPRCPRGQTPAAVENQPVSDDLLVADFYDWASEKNKYPEDRLRRALNWMREKGIVPMGWGKIIARAKK
jgi:hypothetical protein